MPDINRVIGRKLQQARVRAGLSKTELAERLGIAKQSYNDYEPGSIKFRVEQVEEFSRALGRPVEWFLGIDTDLSEDEAQVLHLWRQIEAPQIRRTVLDLIRGQLDLDRELRGER